MMRSGTISLPSLTTNPPNIKQLVEQFMGATLAQAEHSGGKAETLENVANYNPASDLYQIDPEDLKFLKGKDPSFVRGWNQVKRGVK
jgi:hypothetical protein